MIYADIRVGSIVDGAYNKSKLWTWVLRT